MEIDYAGEHLIPGTIGRIFVILSFVSALYAAFCYYSSEKKNSDLWKKLGRIGYHIHSFSIAGIIGSLFYLLVNHYFEYQYVWDHSNTEMPMRYILSSFWEGQEGSFLLWAFWHVVLGQILMRTSGNWEAPVLTVFSCVQVFLSSMLLGIYIFNYKIGSNPFLLVREMPDNIGLPWTQMSDYLQRLPFFQDGRGLNPLLQNYWMTIHPPTLFLGFASTLIPFSYAMAGLWRKDFSGWLKPALPWSVFGVMVLGTGILMGGAWAYEALSFGGFWAWDPVENASLVPWLTFLGATHLMMIHKNKGTSLFTLFLLTFLTFIFVLYSTFLTRSGVLGDSSVHAFTDLGMSGQLLIYLLFFLFLSFYMLIKNYRHLPKSKTEEATWSREFWMFIGALVLFISAFQISFSTSRPVINKIFGTELAPPTNIADYYHKFQIPFAIIITLLIGFTQFLKYKNTDFNSFLKKIAPAFIISLVISGVSGYFLELFKPFYFLLFFSSVFAVLANLDYFIRILKGKVNKAGGSIAHIGMGMVLLGALISTGKSKIISQNRTGIDISRLDENLPNHENILLFKDDTIQMDDYHVAYRGKTKDGIFIRYKVEYMTKQPDNAFSSAFTLSPFVQLNPRMGNVAEPDTRHFLTKDIYTHVTYAELSDPEKDAQKDDAYGESKVFQLAVGDSMFSSNSIIVLDSLERINNLRKLNLDTTDIAVSAHLRVIDIQNNTYNAQPVFVLKDSSYVVPFPDELESLGLKFTFEKILTEEDKVEIKVAEKSDSREFIIMKAIVFPGINILWTGCILMIIGTLIAIVNRVRRW